MPEAAKAKRPSLKKYKREKREKTEAPAGTVMVGMGGPPSSYISNVLDLFSGDTKVVTLMGRGAAQGKTIRIAEIVRRRVKGLHMSKEVTTESVTDKYVGKKEDDKLEPVTVESTVKSMKLVLSLDALDEKSPGYKAPLDESKVTAEDKEKRAERGKKTPGRGRGKGKKGAKGRGRGAKKDEFAWLPVRRGAGGARGGGGGRGKGLPSRGGGRKGLPSRGGGRTALPSRGGGRQGGGGGFIKGVPRSRGAGSRPYSGGAQRSRGGGGGRPAPVRSRGGGGARPAPRSRGGGGGYSGPPRSRGAGMAAPPRSRGGARRY